MSNSFDLMMFRFNLWAKPFFPPPQSVGPGMENSTYLPNPLTSPALMVLASTAEASRDGNRLPAPHPYPGHSVGEKEGMVSPYNSSFPSMYRQGDPFPSPLYAPLPPFVRSSLDRGVGFINPGGGSAFRPVSSTGEVPDGYHSAFTPSKRTKLDNSDNIVGQYITERQDFDKKSEIRASPVVKEERNSCESSPLCDTNSESQSEHGDLNERGTPDEGRNLRKQRKKHLPDGQTPCCPVCGITLRAGEVESHYVMELEKLEKISRSTRKCSKDSSGHGRKGPLSPSTSRGGRDSPPEMEGVPNSRFETYLRIKCNRQNRLSARCRSKRKKPDEAACPICNERLSGSLEELNGHVEQCLKKRGETEDETVDVEGEYEEYTWAGQTRVRATTMLQGGYASYGFQIASKRNGSDDDVDINVDGDETEIFGRPQYSEIDVIPCSADEPDEDKARQALRGAVLECASSSTPSPGTSPGLAMDLSKATTSSCENGTEVQPHSNLPPSGGCSREGEIIQSLKDKLREKDQFKGDKFKCLICMEAYNKPLVSTQCWHVHCEECWLRTLGAKKLCPQCNTITSPGDLRRLFL